jgi:hypothetical protein
LRLGRIDWKRARCELRAALVLGESADTGRVVRKQEVIQVGPMSNDKSASVYR